MWWVGLKEVSNQTYAYFVIWEKEKEILLDVYEFEFEFSC